MSSQHHGLLNVLQKTAECLAEISCSPDNPSLVLSTTTARYQFRRCPCTRAHIQLYLLTFCPLTMFFWTLKSRKTLNFKNAREEVATLVYHLIDNFTELDSVLKNPSYSNCLAKCKELHYIIGVSFWNIEVRGRSTIHIKFFTFQPFGMLSSSAQCFVLCRSRVLVRLESADIFGRFTMNASLKNVQGQVKIPS